MEKKREKHQQGANLKKCRKSFIPVNSKKRKEQPNGSKLNKDRNRADTMFV